MNDQSQSTKPRIAILYHYMYPDDVVSACHFDGLAASLARSGWDVEALPCNRGCRNETEVFKSNEIHEGVRYQRVWRPRVRQASYVGRLWNSCWMMVAWTLVAFRPKKRRPHIVIVGTDPIFSVLVSLPLSLFAPDIKIVHWCFDLHPEAAVANRLLRPTNFLVRFVKTLLRAAYGRCALIADIGPCMRRRLRKYGHHAKEIECTPWALLEPDSPVECDPIVRKELFGGAALAVLYSGNFGEAHSYSELLSLARRLRDTVDVHFCFAVRGNKVSELNAALTSEDHNITFAGFASLEELAKRLGSADVHITTLHDHWAGVAVPSKFFGSLASGRPVLFSGPADSAIGDWITRLNIGWVLCPENVEQVAAEFRRLANERSELMRLQELCHESYQQYFSMSSVTTKWDYELRELLMSKPS